MADDRIQRTWPNLPEVLIAKMFSFGNIPDLFNFASLNRKMERVVYSKYYKSFTPFDLEMVICNCKYVMHDSKRFYEADL